MLQPKSSNVRVEREDMQEDYEAIRSLKYRYGALVDSLTAANLSAAEAVGEIFTEDAIFDFRANGGPLLGNRVAIVDLFRTVIGPALDFAWHVFDNPIIEFIDVNTARGIWMMNCLSIQSGDDRRRLRQTLGRYHDIYVRGPGGWRQSKFNFQLSLDRHIESMPVS